MIVILCGFSASGKDTYMKLILEKYEKNIFRPVTYTTRPMRLGEVDGVDYFFIKEKDFKLKLQNNQIFNHREYNVIDNGKPNIWHYGIPKESFVDNKNYILILDPYGAAKMKEKYGNNVKIIYIECSDDVAIERVLKRGDSLDELKRRRDDDKKQFILISSIIDLSLNTNADRMFDENMRKISNFLEDNIW